MVAAAARRAAIRRSARTVEARAAARPARRGHPRRGRERGRPRRLRAALQGAQRVRGGRRARRGYFVEWLGAAQFAASATVDRLRELRPPAGASRRAGRRSPSPRPTRPTPTVPRCPGREAGARRRAGTARAARPGALVVLVDGAARRSTSSAAARPCSPSPTTRRARRGGDLAHPHRAGRLGKLRVERIDGEFSDRHSPRASLLPRPVSRRHRRACGCVVRRRDA